VTTKVAMSKYILSGKRKDRMQLTFSVSPTVQPSAAQIAGAKLPVVRARVSDILIESGSFLCNVIISLFHEILEPVPTSPSFSSLFNPNRCRSTPCPSAAHAAYCKCLLTACLNNAIFSLSDIFSSLSIASAHALLSELAARMTSVRPRANLRV
jgi:hypothetical protein